MDKKGKKNNRIYWIDTMKVLGMYFIVLGHMFPVGHKSIYAFSVPLFFFLSGILSKKESDYKIFFEKVLRTLVVPMIFFCIISFIYHILRYHIPIKSIIENGHLWLIRNLSGYQTSLSVGGVIFPGLNACWFIYTLILVKIVFNFIPIKIQCFIILPLSIISAIYFNHCNLYIGNSFINSLLAYPIFILGYLCKPYINYWTEKPITSSLLGWITFILSLVLLIIIPEYNNWPRMYINDYGNNILLFIIGIILGLYATYFIAMLIGHKFNNIISTLSMGNILTLGIHSYFVAALHGSGLLNGYIDWFYAILIMLIMIPIIDITKKLAPWIIGFKIPKG